MELVFRENNTQYPYMILCENLEREETVDVIIPDSYPDVQEIVNAFGTAVVYSMELGSGSVSLAGEVQAGVIYEGQEGEIRCVKARIPFSFRQELKEQAENGDLQCLCNLQSVDARILNSRKLLLRAGVSCCLKVYGKKEYSFYEIEDPAPKLQLKRTVLPLNLPLALGEKRFSIQEELELPQGKPAIVHLLRCLYQPRVLEQKAVGDKAVFKGELQIQALYESEDESLCVQEWTLPFSQYAVMEKDAEDCELQTFLTLTGADTQPDGQPDSRRLLTSVELLGQCVARGTCNAELIEDAFCIDGDLEPEFKEQKLTGLLDRQTFRETVSLQTDSPAKNVLAVWSYPTKALRQREGDLVAVEQGIGCDILYYDAEGKLKGQSLKGFMQVKTQLEEQAQCRVEAVCCAEPFCTVNASGICVQIPVELSLESTAEHSLKAVCAGKISQKEHAEDRPALILRFTKEAEDLWQIAKSCKTSARAIREANDLTDDSVPADTLLLIPM